MATLQVEKILLGINAIGLSLDKGDSGLVGKLRKVDADFLYCISPCDEPRHHA